MRHISDTGLETAAVQIPKMIQESNSRVERERRSIGNIEWMEYEGA